MQDRALRAELDDRLDAMDRFHDGGLFTRIDDGILGVVTAVRFHMCFATG
jgi:hypothetical protein